jgi:hypothetical protein
MGGSKGLAWQGIVSSARRRAKDQGLQIIISPRSTFNGIALMQAGFTAEETVDMTLAAGLQPEQKRMIGLHMLDTRAFEELAA